VGEGDLFRAMGIPLLAGRYFDKADLGKEAGTVIINETMAHRCWPGQNALHKTFRQKNGATLRVIGIVADARIGLRSHHLDPVEPTFFRPYHEKAAGGGFGPFFVVRTERDPQPLIPVMLERIRSVESSMTTPWFQVARQTIYASTEAPRLYMLYLVVFASVGLLLTALGIYGVLAYSVSRRTREIGIRLAIGAQWHHVMRMVLREGTRLVAAGVVIGLLGTFCLTRFLQNQLFEVSPTDPGVLLSVVLILSAVALLACALPAFGATRTNPVTALKAE
jgi:hypothetical protein